jgi:transcriptional regulator with PAS, ATPase and Fis domain
LLSLIQNRKLSRIGESKERLLDVRFIFATNENLKKAVAENRFRKDLYYRINTVELNIPSLRERLEDSRLWQIIFWISTNKNITNLIWF